VHGTTMKEIAGLDGQRGGVKKTGDSAATTSPEIGIELPFRHRPGINGNQLGDGTGRRFLDEKGESGSGNFRRGGKTGVILKHPRRGRP